MEIINKNEQTAQPERLYKETLPNANSVLAMGIISIASCWCWGLIGIVLGIIALVLYGRDIQLYTAEPERYTQTSLANLNAGRVCAIIGLVLSVVFGIGIILKLIFFGAAFTSLFHTLPW